MAGRVLLVAFAALALGVGAMGFAPAHAGSGPFPVVDMFTTYQVEPLRHSVVWTTCGNRPRTVGCYGGGKLGGFQRVCALLQGLPERRGNVVSRAVYVLDGGAAEGVPLVLSVYRRTDAFSQSDDMTTVRLLMRVRLLATGGPATSCFFAANSHSLYVGSSTSPLAERVDKGAFGVTTLFDASTTSPPSTLTSITADDLGNISLRLSTGRLLDNEVYGPDDAYQADGEGGELLGTTVALDVPPTVAIGSSAVSSGQR